MIYYIGLQEATIEYLFERSKSNMTPSILEKSPDTRDLLGNSIFPSPKHAGYRKEKENINELGQNSRGESKMVSILSN